MPLKQLTLFHVGANSEHWMQLQVLKCFADTNLVFWGDSMVRQLFGRLPSLFRGQLRSVDSNRWRATRYDVCECAPIPSYSLSS